MYNNYKTPNTSTDILKTTGPAALGTYYTNINNNTLNLDNYCLVSPYTKFKKPCKECFNPNESYIYTSWNDGTGWGFDINKKYIYLTISITIILAISIFLYIRYRRHRIIS